MSSDPVPPHSPPAAGPAPLLPLLFAGVLGLAVIGFVAGLNRPGARSVAPYAPPAPRAATGAAVIPIYAEMDARSRGPNAAFSSDVRRMGQARPALTDPVVQTAADKEAALAARAERRAYHGAPPTIPHPIAGHEATSCLACHRDGLRIDARIAPKMSHPLFSQCLQCHAQGERAGQAAFARAAPRGGTATQTAEPPATHWGAATAASHFTGLASPQHGVRAWPGAPPTIPHSQWMRQDCTSCHGTLGQTGMRSTHPWRLNCVQCHAASAAYDLRPFLDPALPPGPPLAPIGSAAPQAAHGP